MASNAKKTKGAIMATSKQNGEAAFKVPADEKIEYKHITDLTFDESWNARHVSFLKGSGHQVSNDSVDDTSGGQADLKGSLAMRGQDEAVICRWLVNKKGEKYLSGVTGFRRYNAISELAAEAADPEFKGDKSKPVYRGLIKVQVRDLTEREARELNIRENTVRNQLVGVDLAWSIRELAKNAPDATQEEIGAIVGKNQPYVGKMMKIAEKVAPKYLAAWRDEPTNRSITTDEMNELANLGMGEPQDRAWEELLKSRIKTDKVKKGKDAWQGPAEANAKRLGLLLTKLEALKIVTPAAAGRKIEESDIDELADIFFDLSARGKAKEASEFRAKMAAIATSTWKETAKLESERSKIDEKQQKLISGN